MSVPKFIPVNTNAGRAVINANEILVVQEEYVYGGPICVVITTQGRFELTEIYESFILRLNDED